MTTEVAVPGEAVSAELARDAPSCQGFVIIEWPQPVARAERRWPHVIAGYELFVLNAEDEKPLLTVMRAEIHVDPSNVVTADLTMWADPDGRPLTDNSVIYYRGDELITGTYRFWVSAIRNYGSQQEIRERIGTPGVHSGRSRIVHVG